MNKALIFLGTVAGLFILAQWYVFLCVRNFIFDRRLPITRKVAYPVLVMLGLLNYLCIKFSMETAMLGPDSAGQKIVAVAFFAYLGFVLLCCLFFGLLELGSLLLYIKDLVAKRGRRPNQSPVKALPFGQAHQLSPVDGQAGGAQSEPLPAGCKAELNAQAPKEVMSPNEPRSASSDETVPTYSRRSFLKWGTVAGLTSAACLTGGGVAQAYAKPAVERFDFEHPALGGLIRPVTLIQITDFHIGLFFGNRELERLVQEVNALEADALLITGDVFHSPMSPVEEAGPLLARLRPRKHGTFAVLGNHDFYVGEHRSVKTLQRAGITLLRDEWVTLKEGLTDIHLGGVDDPVADWIWGKDFPNFASFVDEAPRGEGVRILLSHRPSILEVASVAGIDLVLAGHVHGGQVIIPVPGSVRGVSLAAIASRYTHGWYRHGDCRMYLNRGAGLTFVPFRINCPPEIAVFRLMPPAKT